MSEKATATAVDQFNELPEGTRLVVLLLAYGLVGVGLVYALGIDGGSIGGFTGLGGVST
ncbi:hypothetical protein [Natronobacterium texcoconense]|uniref:Uncharacterized protein n=1 Tax=Natronobacterium texcoconense TaxID=1095778 RepID=A0A1H0YYU6_NATTX|nr:hypothetical protein [Natronobacterium texcoconense]SDQ20447.1 hypothetical protein SAMN04489842_0067 [Natronobacterium texcoconense]